QYPDSYRLTGFKSSHGSDPGFIKDRQTELRKLLHVQLNPDSEFSIDVMWKLGVLTQELRDD
ncbi:hypothetical protein TNCT_575761, partial [Trichonephila clavata]